MNIDADVSFAPVLHLIYDPIDKISWLSYWLLLFDALLVVLLVILLSISDFFLW